MINLFDIPADDQSVFYLGQIFGFITGVLPAANAPMSLGNMFRVFNSIVLVVGVLIVIYTTVVGVMKTAHEGQFMGKDWNNIWIPIRMVLGIAALVPTVSGYSAIQIVMMWVILQGVGAADTIWSTVLKYKESFGSITAPVSVPTADLDFKFTNLFQAMMCQSALHANYTSGYFCHGGSGGFCGLSEDAGQLWNIKGSQSSPSGNYINYGIGPDKACGSLTFLNDEIACNNASTPDAQLQCSIAQAQVASLQAVVSVYGAIAKDFTETDYQFRSFYGIPNVKAPTWVMNYCNANGIAPESCCAKIDVPWPSAATCALPNDFSTGKATSADPNTVSKLYWPYKIQPDLVGNIDFVGAAITNYAGNIATTANQTQTSNTTITDDTLVQANNLGWIFAGAYYYTLSRDTGKRMEWAMPHLDATANDPSSDPTYSSYRNNSTAAGSLTSAADAAVTSQDGFALSLPKSLKKLGKISTALNKTASHMANAFMKNISGGTNSSTGLSINPLIALQSLGKNLLITAQVLFAVVIYAIPALTIAGYFNVFVAGTGVENFLGPTVTTLSILFAPFFFLFLTGLFVYGALLAIYTPLIPYVVFTLGAVSWFILVIEAMVAGPLVALGILIPGGHGDILGKAEGALMYLFGLFLRPGLMIFGMIAAMLLAIVAVSMINAGFKGVMGQVYENPGLVETMLFLAAYISLVLAVLNKCFTLIHVVPDRVLRWMGAHPEETGGAGELGEVKSGVKSGAAGVQGMGSQAAGRAQAAGKAGAEYKALKEKQGAPSVKPKDKT